MERQCLQISKDLVPLICNCCSVGAVRVTVVMLSVQLVVEQVWLVHFLTFPQYTGNIQALRL
jgi:hypothetical protein